ncbi:MAG: polyprenyl synthetase family protein, partial [Candidatus Electryoneaceae bacterium]|nr:polyprenyl synthetase family protein [Candidatus Electryoneaceae bacterium]
VELFHTWTLVHDDIIDRDALRRGNETVHEHFLKKAHFTGEDDFSLSLDEAHHYGVSIAIMTGDIQHGWGISMMTELSTLYGVDPMVTLNLIDDLDTKVLNTLVEGEVLDIQFAYRDIESLTPQMIEDMLWKKTGALLEFCGRAGAIIGTGNPDDPKVEAVSKFAALCGTAFQLQDDILGVIGKEETLGKPIGSDLREGKRTLVVHQAYHNATTAERKKILAVLGNPSASRQEVVNLINMLRDLGAIDYVSDRAKTMIEQARPHLDILPDTHYKHLLHQWADYMIQREF